MSSSASIDVVTRPTPHRSEAERLRASRRRGWALAGYSLALLVVAGILTAASAAGEVWRAYGTACLVFGGLVGVGAVVLLLRDRPGLSTLPGRIVGGVRETGARAGQSAAMRRTAVAERKFASDRVIGGLPGMAVTQARVVRSEWTKLYSVRSTTIVLGVAVLLLVGLAALLAAVFAAQWDDLTPLEQQVFRPGTDPLSGVALAQLAVGILGVLVASSEYSTGMIRATLAAVPRRVGVLWGKLAVVCGVVGVVSLVSMFAAFWISQALLSGKQLNVGLDEPYVLHVIFSAPVYLMLVAGLGVALGALLRHTAGAISALVGLLFLVPILFAFLPSAWTNAIGPYLFGAAGQAFWAVPQGRQITDAGAAFVVVLAWVGAAFAGACYRLLRDDA